MKKLIFAALAIVSFASCGLHTTTLYAVHTTGLKLVFTSVYSEQSMHPGQIFVQNGHEYMVDRVEDINIASSNGKIVY